MTLAGRTVCGCDATEQKRKKKIKKEENNKKNRKERRRHARLGKKNGVGIFKPTDGRRRPDLRPPNDDEESILKKKTTEKKKLFWFPFECDSQHGYKLH